MELANRPKPKTGETWIYITGQRFKILDVKLDPGSREERVIYRDYDSHEKVFALEMDEFMATFGEDGGTLICYFQKVDPL